LQTQPQVSNNLEAQLQQQIQVLAQGFQAAITERDAAYRVVDSLMPFMQVNALLNQEIEEMDKAIASLTPFVQVAAIWAQDALAHEQVLNNVVDLMNSPDFLVYWANRVWSDRIQHNGQAALEWISDEYLNLLNTYEQKFMMTNNGQHSPMWYRMQPKTVNSVMGSVDSENYRQDIPVAFQQPPQQYAPQYQQPPQQYAPMPPIPGNNSGMGGPIEELKARVNMLKSGAPDLGQALQRMHAQNRQSMGADIYV
jgi:hypothetical protein